MSIFVGDNPGSTLLHDAVRDGHVDVVRTLLEAGADPDAQMLCDAGASLNITDNSRRTPFYVAATAGHIDTVRILVNAESNRGGEQA